MPFLIRPFRRFPVTRLSLNTLTRPANVDRTRPEDLAC